MIEKLGPWLIENGFRETSFSIGVNLDERYCILFNYSNMKYEVFYSERGNKTNLMKFENEKDAAQYFKDLIGKSVTARDIY